MRFQPVDSELDDDLPLDYCCPITNAVMRDPVFLAESDKGYSFERAAITHWLHVQNKNTCPVSRDVLITKALIPNRALKSSIDAFLAQQARIKELEASLEETQRDMEKKNVIIEGLKRDWSILNQKVIDGAESVHSLQRASQQKQVVIDRLSAENKELTERLRNQTQQVQENFEISTPADPKRARSLAVQANSNLPVQKAPTEPGLFSNRASRSPDGKLIPQGLICIVQTLGTLGINPKEGLSFSGVTLIFESEADGVAFRNKLHKISENTDFPIVMYFSSRPRFGDITNSDRFFDLVLPNSKSYFMAVKKPELHGLLTLDVFEKNVDVTGIPKYVYSLKNEEFHNIKALSYKIKPAGLECIVLELDTFFGSNTRGLSFTGVKLIFNSSENLGVFVQQIRGICEKLKRDSSLACSRYYSPIGEYQNGDAILDLKPVLNSELYNTLDSNIYLSGVMLLHALEQFFDISGVKKAIRDMGAGKWVNQETDEPLRHNL